MRLTLTDWHRERFAVHLLADPVLSLPERSELVRGALSGPFGVYAGTPSRAGHQSNGRKAYTLVHMPSQMAHLTLPREGLCRQAAADLAACDLAWESAWVLGVVGPGLEQAQEVYRRWKSWGHRRSWGERR